MAGRIIKFAMQTAHEKTDKWHIALIKFVMESVQIYIYIYISLSRNVQNWLCLHVHCSFKHSGSDHFNTVCRVATYAGCACTRCTYYISLRMRCDICRLFASLPLTVLLCQPGAGWTMTATSCDGHIFCCVCLCGSLWAHHSPGRWVIWNHNILI